MHSEIFCYAVLADKNESTIYSDRTGWFPVRSYSSKNYIFVAYVYSKNAILMRPLAARNDNNMVKTSRYPTSAPRPRQQMLQGYQNVHTQPRYRHSTCRATQPSCERRRNSSQGGKIPHDRCTGYTGRQLPDPTLGSLPTSDTRSLNLLQTS